MKMSRSLPDLGTLVIAIAAALPSFVCGAWAEDVMPLPAAHAHNDYYHGRPLLDALSHGFCSVEADVFLVDGELLVAHGRDELDAQRTLRGLYLDPLRERAQKNNGRIYRGDITLTLLVDIKSDGPSTYRALDKLLADYASILSSFENGQVTDRAVVVIVSGNRPIELMANQTRRFAFVDGRLSDLERKVDVKLMPLISDRWSAHFEWNGQGAIPAEERDQLHAIVKRTHERGQRLRFWATPDLTNVWQTLHEADVDLINTDDLRGLSSYLRTER